MSIVRALSGVLAICKICKFGDVFNHSLALGAVLRGAAIFRGSGCAITLGLGRAIALYWQRAITVWGMGGAIAL